MISPRFFPRRAPDLADASQVLSACQSCGFAVAELALPCQAKSGMNTLDYKRAYQRHLPHFQPPGVTFFITTRLAGSLPLSALADLARRKKQLALEMETQPLDAETFDLECERFWFSSNMSSYSGLQLGAVTGIQESEFRSQKRRVNIQKNIAKTQ